VTVTWRALALAAPFLVAAVPVVSLWAANRLEFPATALLPILLVTSALAAIALGIGRLIAGRWTAGAVAASIALAAIGGYGLLVDLAGVLTTPERAEELRPAITLAAGIVSVILIVAATILARRGRFDGGDAARAISVAAAGFMLAGLLGPPDPNAHADGGGESGAVLHHADAAETPAPPVAVAATRASEPLPDVYLVVLDGYTRSDVLDEVYGFDNEPFLGELEDRGFYVARESYANYPATYLALASVLNERYLTSELVARRTQNDYLELIRRGEVPGAFKRLGYRYVLVRSIWEGTARSPLADELLGQGATFGSELAASVVDRTLVGPLVPQGTVAGSHLAAFDALANAPAGGGPTFTLAHIVAPHPPYVLDRDGNPISDAVALKGSWAGEENRRGYLEQLRFVNRRMLEVVDAILTRSTTPPIIVVMGDHGVFGATFDQDEARRATAARLAILNAYLVPEELRASLTPSISPVNSFRLVLSGLTGRQPSLLEDRSFYYEDKRPGPFVEVEPDFSP
jgi:hypothetical protein